MIEQLVGSRKNAGKRTGERISVSSFTGSIIQESMPYPRTTN